MRVEIRGGGSGGVVPDFVVGRREGESPTPGALCDRRLRRFVDLDARGFEDTTVVDAACTRTMRVDGATPIAEHRAVAAFVIAEKDVTLGRSGRRKEQLR